MSDYAYVESFLPQIHEAPDLTALETLRIGTLGKSGEVTALLKTLGAMTPEERQAEGPKIHALREAVTAAIADRKAALEAAVIEARLATERLDMSLPVSPGAQGTVHPVAQVMDELRQFRQAGASPWADDYNPLASFRGGMTRAEVMAEFHRGRAATAALTAEDSGSSYLARMHLPAAGRGTELARME